MLRGTDPGDAPRLWGLIGATGVFIYGLLGIVGVDTGLGSPYMVLAMPVAVQEMVFAAYLIARGLRAPQAQPRQMPEPQVQPVG